jgi:hypothetical protein
MLFKLGSAVTAAEINRTGRKMMFISKRDEWELATSWSIAESDRLSPIPSAG